MHALPPPHVLCCNVYCVVCVVSQVIRLLTGTSPDDTQSSAVTSFFLTSSFHPAALPSAGGSEEAWLQRSLHLKGRGSCQVRVNHTTASTQEVYAAALATVRETAGDMWTDISALDLVPFYW
jgi:hypothetical protein